MSALGYVNYDDLRVPEGLHFAIVLKEPGKIHFLLQGVVNNLATEEAECFSPIGEVSDLLNATAFLQQTIDHLYQRLRSLPKKELRLS